MFTLTLTPEMVQIIGKSLGAQPFDAVEPVIAELRKQINEQQQQQPQPVGPES